MFLLGSACTSVHACGEDANGLPADPPPSRARTRARTRTPKSRVESEIFKFGTGTLALAHTHAPGGPQRCLVAIHERVPRRAPRCICRKAANADLASQRKLLGPGLQHARSRTRSRDERSRNGGHGRLPFASSRQAPEGSDSASIVSKRGKGRELATNG